MKGNMRKSLVTFLLVFLSGCNVFNSEVPEYFWANVQFHNISDPDNVNYETFSVIATMWKNEGGIQERSKIWISFNDEASSGTFFQLPPSTRIVGVRLKRVSENIYDFIAFRDPSVVEFKIGWEEGNETYNGRFRNFRK